MRCLPSRIQDRNEILRQMLRHAISLRLRNNKRKRQKHTPEETETRSNRNDKFHILQRTNEIHNIKRLLGMLQPRLEGHVGNAQHSQDQKGADTHCPGESDFGNQIRYHDWENHTSQT